MDLDLLATRLRERIAQERPGWELQPPTRDAGQILLLFTWPAGSQSYTFQYGAGVDEEYLDKFVRIESFDDALGWIWNQLRAGLGASQPDKPKPPELIPP